MAISQFPVPASGIPTGDTAGRPASPVIGDVYYNGELGILEIFDGTSFVPCSAPAATPTIAVADVGTSVAYGSAQGLVTITEGTSGGLANTFLISASTGGYTATTTGTTVTITVGNNDSYTFSGQGINNFGTSVAGPNASETLTTVPEAPTIGTATTSGSTTDVTVAWTLGADGGKNLSAITVTPFLDGTTAQTATTAATTSSTSATIAGLTANSAYTFKVKTTNANGTSAESAATDSITVPNLMEVEYLVVAGGAGAGGASDNGGTPGGGGGAGGFRTSTLGLELSTNYTVTVGAGGSAGSRITSGVNGSNSVFSTITSTGGGRGSGQASTPNSGGSGGGGCGTNGGDGNAGAFTPSEGNDGGDGDGGGGGGATGVGSDGVGSGGNRSGGAGTASSITGSSVTYAGGGGGGGHTAGGTGTPGAGGAGGGAAGVDSGNAVAATANTGGGGGGGGAVNGGTSNPSAGGSGVVILRWLTAAMTITVGAGLTADATGTDGSYSYKRFTAGSGNVSFA
jgi:hypothetical protein